MKLTSWVVVGPLSKGGGRAVEKGGWAGTKARGGWVWGGGGPEKGGFVPLTRSANSKP